MLYIMRHGKTDWNEKYKLQGRSDIPLNEAGREMARAAAREYQDLPLDICYCSPLLRAKETAELVLAGRGVPIVPDERLAEMCFGEAEGMERCYEHPEHPIYAFFKDPEHYQTVSGAESFAELFARTGSFLQEIKPQLAEGKNILIVGHGAMNASIICQVKKLPLSHFWDAGLAQCKMQPLAMEGE